MSNAKTLDQKTQAASAAAEPKKNEAKGIAVPTTQEVKQETIRKGRKPVDPNESKDKKFRRLANMRVPKALRAIGYIANLGNANQYEYTPEQADKILAALLQAVQAVKISFNGEKKAADSFSV